MLMPLAIPAMLRTIDISSVYDDAQRQKEAGSADRLDGV